MVCKVQDFVEPGIKLEKKANTLSPVHNNDDGSANVVSQTSREKVVFFTSHSIASVKFLDNLID